MQLLVDTLLEPFALSQLTEAWISFTAPFQSRPSIKCCASATSKPTLPRYKLVAKMEENTQYTNEVNKERNYL